MTSSITMPVDAQHAYLQNDPGSTLLVDGAPAELHCPFLGLRDDPDTHFTFPSVNSYCHRVSPMQRVGLEHQATGCLSANHLTCPVFTGNQSDWTWKGPLPAQVSDQASPFHGRAGWLLLALASALVILLIAAYLGTRLAAHPSNPPVQAGSFPTVGQPSPALPSPLALFTATGPGDALTMPAATEFVLAPVPGFTAAATGALAESAAVSTLEDGPPVILAGSSTVEMQILLPVLVQDGAPELASLVQDTPRISGAIPVTSLPSATQVTPQLTPAKKMVPAPTNTPTQPASPTASSRSPEPSSTVTPAPTRPPPTRPTSTQPPPTQPPASTPLPPNSPVPTSLPPAPIIPTLQPTLPPTIPPTLSPTEPPPTATNDFSEEWPTTPTPVIEKTSTAADWRP